MSDEQIQPGAEEAVTDAESQEQEAFSPEYVKKLRAEAASYRVKLKEIEERDKTDAEKSADRLAALEKENTQFRLEKQRTEWAEAIAADSHIPASALRGDTEEDLRKHFDQLRSLIPESTNPRTVIPGDAEKKPLALNGDGLEGALRKALGLN